MTITIKAVIFDLDGTLIDSMPTLYKSLNGAVKRRGLPEIEVELMGKMAGRPIVEMLTAKRKTLSRSVISLVERDFFNTYVERSLIDCKLFPQVREILTCLRSRGIHLGILTTTPGVIVERDLRRFSISEYFGVVVTRESVTNIKPSPEGVIKAIETLGVRKDECFYVGDSPMDVKTGKAAGVRTVAVRTGISTEQQLQDEKPDVMIDNLTYLPSLIFETV